MKKRDRFIIGPTSGKQTIAMMSGELIMVDPNFKEWSKKDVLNIPSEPRPATCVKIRRVHGNFRFSDIRKQINMSRREILLTQSQIVKTIKTHRSWLPLAEEGAILFFFQIPSGKTFVATARRYTRKKRTYIYVGVHRDRSRVIWKQGDGKKYSVIIPSRARSARPALRFYELDRSIGPTKLPNPPLCT